MADPIQNGPLAEPQYPQPEDPSSQEATSSTPTPESSSEPSRTSEMPSLDYVKMVQAAAKNILPILMKEYQTVATTGGSFFDMSCFGICIQTIAELGDKAEQIEKQLTGLVVAENPGLVGPDGNPISRQARRQIERKKGKV